MSSSYFFCAFGTFGNPNGFRQSLLGGNAELSKQIKTFDLKTDAIKLFPNTKLYGIRKEAAAGQNIISYSIYTFAKEQNSERGGTFVGSSLIFLNTSANENLIIDVLNEFHTNLENKNVQNETFIVNHSKDFSVSKPKDFDKIGLNEKPLDDLNFSQSTGNYLVVYCKTEPSQLQELFNRTTVLLNVYDMIYFTDAKEIAEFVNQKGIFKIVEIPGLNNEIKKFDDEQKSLLEKTTHSYENEKQKLEDERKLLISELENKIQLNEKKHAENSVKIEESKKKVKAVNANFNEFELKLNECISKLKSGEKLVVIKQFHQENKKIFTEKINQNSRIESLSSLSSSSATKQRSPSLVMSSSSDEVLSGYSKQPVKSRGNSPVFIIISIILGLSVIGMLVFYFMFSKEGKSFISSPAEENYAGNSVKDTIKQEIEEFTEQNHLNPFPNSTLNENDVAFTGRKLNTEIKMDSVLKIIYKENPTTIQEYYKHQKKDYAEYLYNGNSGKFEIRNNRDTILINTNLSIPNYK
ncbi:hypothetical protein ABEG63_10990 [Chryseobacterium sp. C39-AII1]|uniref:hypothetical protein n=1 Tax=Chryseobacterium sp. C39-AII1 TaxID=3080332 RepID=UPI003207B62F